MQLNFIDGIAKISDLRPDMVLEGTVTNVTAFGAFVDIGVHQDGLVHISALAERFVKDPRDVVKAGDIVRVKVMDVDPSRRRIALSMRLADKASEHGGDKPAARRTSQRRPEGKPPGGKGRRDEPAANNAFAAAFAQARKKR